MKTKTPQDIIRNYKLKFAGAAVLCALILAALIWLMTVNMPISIFLIAVMAFNIRKPFEELKKKDIESVLYEELDPERFAELVRVGGFEKSKKYSTLCAMTLGEHEKVLSLTDELLSKTANPIERCNLFYRKAYVYFEMEDFDGVRAMLKEFEALKRQHAKYAAVFDNFSVFEKFDAYLDEDYEYVRDVCDADLLELSPKHQNHKLTRINVSFYRACALYKLGDTDGARRAFEELIEFAPKMYKAKLAQKWLDKM